MKKIPLDKKYLTISIYVLMIIIISITFEKTIGNFSSIGIFINGVFKIITSILSPFFYGLLIAYLLNSAVKTLENQVLNRIKFLKGKRKITRPISIMVVYIIVIGVIVWIITYLLPEIAASLQRIFRAVENSISQIDTNSTNFYNENGIIQSTLNSFNETFATNYTVDYLIDLLMAPVIKTVDSIPDFINSIPSFINAIYLGTIKIANTVLNVFLGMVIAFYMLSDKEEYSKFMTKIIYLLFKGPVAEKIIKTARVSNTTFEKFFLGKAIDSTIVGIIFFIVATIVKAPYVVLLSLIIGITNMIPYFGPFIGGAPVVLIVLLENPSSPLWLWMILIIFILQQFDGLYLGPKILGDSIGLKPIGVIFSIIVGGAAFGVLGMFFGVPLFAILSSAFGVFINKKYFTKYKPPVIDDERDREYNL